MVTIITQKNILSHLPDLVKESLPIQRLGVVYDMHTLDAVSAQTIEALKSQFDIRVVNLGKKPAASLALSQSIQAQLASCEALLAIGSGTINDLCKHASHAMNIPYGVVATAPSMNGYVSSNASMLDNGHKQSYLAHQPKAVWADVDVLCKAPVRLIRAGLGDVLCRSTVQADWLLSHQILGTAYDASLFDKLLPLEAEMIAQSQRLADKDPTFITLLFRMLMVSGEAMHKAGSSAPASQAEHMIAHTYELLYGDTRNFHGEQIAVTTVTMSRLQDKLLLKAPTIKSLDVPVERFVQLFGKTHAQSLFEDYQKKRIAADYVEPIQHNIHQNWSDIREEIEAIRVPSPKLEMALRKASCPIHYDDLGWYKDRFEHAATHAYLTRNRFTFLDLAAMDMTLRVVV